MAGDYLETHRVNLQNLLHRSSLFRFGTWAPRGRRRWDEPAARKLHVEQHSDSLSDHAKIPACLCRCAPAFSPSFPLPSRMTVWLIAEPDLLGKQNGFVDRLRHLTAQIFSSHVVGAEVLPGVNPAQSRLLRRR